MHSVELMEQAIALAQQLGWQVRYEHLGEVGGGACQFAGKKWIFVDLALTPYEQYEQVLDALRGDASLYTARVPDCLREQLGVRRAA